MRFHIPGLPHTITNRDYLSCAYTQKVRKLCTMLSNLGHEVYHYGCEGSDVLATEDVSIVSQEELWASYPFRENAFFQFDKNDDYHKMFHRRAARAIEERRAPGDFVLCAWGWGHEPITSRLESGLYVVESGIGYPDTFSNFRVFESYAWMAHVYGLREMDIPPWYDSVIPNFFDPEEFEFREEKGDYFLYLGRVTQRKGVDIAAQVTARIGARLVVAGPGSLVNPEDGMDIRGDHIEHVGFADLETRRELLAGAKALFVPTYYLEPFGGVMIEAALSGTPVITTDWGVFPENVLHGVTGYRCRTFEQFVWAANHVDRIRPMDCRQWAVENFGMDRIALMYQEYFEMIQDLSGKGWYERHPGPKDLSWLNRTYPEGATKKPEQEKNRAIGDISRRPRIHIPSPNTRGDRERARAIATMLADHGEDVVWYGEPFAGGPCCRVPGDVSNQDWLTSAVSGKRCGADILLALGSEQASLYESLKDQLLFVEVVTDPFSRPYAQRRIFQSLWQMQFVYGRIKLGNGAWYDSSIPEPVIQESFPVDGEREDFLLFRDMPDGGLNGAEQVAAETGHRLIVVYPEGIHVAPDRYPANLPHVEIVQISNEGEWLSLLARAKGLLLTSYTMGTGRDAIQAGFAGTPVITVDWGDLTETVIHGVTGYRCRSFDQFCHGVGALDTISSEDCRRFARENFSQSRLVERYREYFQMLLGLYGEGWYASHPERDQLDWLVRYYPGEPAPVSRPVS